MLALLNFYIFNPFSLAVAPDERGLYCFNFMSQRKRNCEHSVCVFGGKGLKTFFDKEG